MFLPDNVTIFVIIINKDEEIKETWGIESNLQLALYLLFLQSQALPLLGFKTSLFVARNS
jgi:hypothetical protein